jgi:hypothetical protein
MLPFSVPTVSEKCNPFYLSNGKKISHYSDEAKQKVSE